jgi:Domain of unknown function DUF29
MDTIAPDLSSWVNARPPFPTHSAIKMPLSAAPAAKSPVQYDLDFYAWLQEQASLLRSEQPSGLDWEHLAEELEAMALRHKHELSQRLRILVGHLLKWSWQPTHRSNSWRASIREARIQIRDILGDMPSLKRKLDELLPQAYRDGRDLAADETGLSPDEFPADCPWSFDQLIDPVFMPEGRTTKKQ